MSFTARQQRRYRALVEAAWQADRARGRAEPGAAAARDAWYRAQLREAIGLDSTRGASATHDYDAACLHFATIAGDDESIGYFCGAVERRYRYLIACRMRDLSDIDRQPVNWLYVRAMWQHMRLPLDMYTAPADSLRTVFQALDTHVRRLLNKTEIGNKNE